MAVLVCIVQALAVVQFWRTLLKEAEVTVLIKL